MATIDEISNAFYDYSVKHYEEELRNSEKPSEKNFPTKSTFQEDFQANVDAVYHEINRSYPPEQANYVYKTLLANLNKQSQNPGQSKIVDLSKGKINSQNLKAYSKKVQETLKSRHPERFKVKEAPLENKTLANDSKNIIDFNNPAEKKAYFNNLYKGLLECKTKEEKRNYIQNSFGIKNITDEGISKLEERARVVELRNTFDEDAFRKENPDLEDEEIDQLLEDEAAKQFALEHNKNLEKAIEDNRLMIEFEEKTSDLIRLEQELLNCTDENEKEEIEAKLVEIKKEKKELEEILSLTNEEREKTTKNIEKQTEESLEKTEKTEEISDDIDIGDILDGLNEDSKQQPEESLEATDINEIEGSIEFSEDEDLSDLFDADVLEEKIEEENTPDKQPIIDENAAFTNPILTGADENDLKQEDYTIEVEEKNSLWNKIKSGLSKLKNSILKKLNLTQNKQLKGQAYLDTAENNVRSVNEYTEIKNTFDQSLQVSEADQEKYKKEYEVAKKTKPKTNMLEVDKNTGQSVEF